MKHFIVFLCILFNINFALSQGDKIIYLICKEKFGSEILCSELKDLYVYYDYFEYARGVVSDIESTRAIRNPPDELFTGPTLNERLQTLINYVANKNYELYFESFSLINIDLSDLSSSEIDVKRNAIHKLTSNSLTYKIVYDSSAILVEDFELFDRELVIIKNTLIELRDLYFGLYDKLISAGFKEYADIFGFGGLDIEQKIRPKIGKLHKLIENKKVLFVKKQIEFKNKANNYISNTVNILYYERLFLEKYIDSLNISNAFLEDSLKIINTGYQEMEKTQSELKSDSINVVLVYDKTASMQRQINNNTDLINKLIGDENELNNKLNLQFDSCPNKQTFENCTHGEIKQAYLNSKLNATNDLSKTRNRRKDLELKNVNLIKAIKKGNEDLELYLNPIIEQLSELRITKQISLLRGNQIVKEIANTFSLIQYYNLLLNSNINDGVNISIIQ